MAHNFFINNSEFNKFRYVQLLKNQFSSFSDENFNPERQELVNYKIILENQLYYNWKSEYILLAEEYLKKNPDENATGLFMLEFLDLFRENNEVLEIFEKEVFEQGIKRLDNFSIDPKSTEFSDLINLIMGYCKFLTFDPEDKDGITPDKFREAIERLFFKMEKYVEE